MKIMVFLEGTVTAHKLSIGHSREEVVEQARNKVVMPSYFAEFIPIGDAVKKIAAWKNQRAEILYLTSRRKAGQVDDVRQVLKRHNFPEGKLLFRQEGEEYKDVAERIVPDVLVEDDCESLGGVDELTITHVKPEIKRLIKSIIVKEFAGIDHLPDNISELMA
ncbi:hypothetical protein A3F27_03145 [Candidatus Kaiserbacteria bacterium RIFCSPHIGHO2_12_FULL_53_13]|uniref:Uncharacterized protein n=1 Tax=Candidatus Kaiserbacteria bacterium RIFCSPHIGHO2_12_FULL_53_13 TaxID=1798502 RepID=A0A1F6E6T6_9BACT|nr:MAG: hypothetical protein A3F27_03145 [Candidatus Kaiserbacteria bacterium RIFCSPHIGHO2_12_FULL_53_13]OGG74249.1 MAG: hypothetical protein A3A37_01095 [Candidatus Kaiserbacteria bacterium RIFCSPLOWO2_01_FULL_52_36]